jgi:methylglutaconyl-CoA hydratase
LRDRRAWITLNRPEKRNALDDQMVRELTTAIMAASRDATVKVVLLTGSGSAFCAGADLDYLQRVAAFDLEENRIDSGNLANLFRLIYELRKPVIALVNGPAIAGGCGLATVCDFVIASNEKAKFGYTEAKIGFIPAVVMIFLIKRVGEGHARELLLRGHLITAKEAREIGLITMAVSHDDLVNKAKELSEELISQNSGTSMGLTKEMLSKLHGMNLVEALDFAANMNAAARMTADCKQGMADFLKKEKTSW